MAPDGGAGSLRFAALLLLLRGGAWPCVEGAQAEDAVVREHYGSSFEVPQFENASYDELRRLLLRGHPFVVVDGGKGLKMADWDCDFVRKEFPDSRLRQEGGTSDVNGIRMGSDWSNTKTKFHHADGFPEGAPKLRPFYWDIAKAHVGERHRKWGKDPKAVVRKIVDNSGGPYWLPKQDQKRMGHSSEMWFHPPGAGAPAHMDPHCQTTVSFCFSGGRRWRMMVPPSRPHPDGYFDGEVYGARDRSRQGEWQPSFAFDAPAGSATVVYPGMVHETLATGEHCSSSISQTFEVPVAAAYYRAFWPRFALIQEDVGGCSSLVQDMVVLGTGTQVAPAEENTARRAAQAFAAGRDRDGDGVLSDAELRAANRGSRTLDELRAFHDVNEDGKVTTHEVVDSYVMFAKAMREARSQRRQEL